MTTSVKKRFAVSLASNFLRAGLSFLAGLVVARGLGPQDYGRLMFLLGSFVSVRSLLDLGTSNAFYTFISQARRPLRYYTFYFGWLAAQFLGTTAVVGLLLPDGVLQQAWVGEGKGLILLAFAATFLQQQLWLTVNQIAEASRKTVRVQALNLALAAVYLAGAYAMTALSALSVRAVLLLLISQYVLAALAAFKVLGPAEPGVTEGEEDLPGLLRKYRDYCAPLALLSVTAFLYDFADKWMLQRFGGAIQQGFYQVSYQFASISVLATASILNIFWKETAEAVRNGNMARVEGLFRKVSRGLFMFGALISGFLIPWSRELVDLFLGAGYASAAPVLALMFLYPVHQALGQIATTLLLALEKTRQYFYISLAVMVLSFPAAYFLLAPSGWAVPGLGLGAIGLALKMVIVNVISVNLILWVIARDCGWRYEFLYQAAGLAAAVAIGAAAKFLALRAAGLPLAAFFLAAGLYAAGAGALLLRSPYLSGFSREEILAYLKPLRREP